MGPRISYNDATLRAEYEQTFKARTLDPIEGFWEIRNEYVDSVSVIYRTEPSENRGFPFALRNLRIVQKVPLRYRWPDLSQVCGRLKPASDRNVYYGQSLMMRGSRNFWEDMSIKIMDPTTLEFTSHASGPVLGRRTWRMYLVGPDEVVEARLRRIASVENGKPDVSPMSSGSGFVVSPTLAVTSYHVVSDSKSIRCYVGDAVFHARLLAHDKQNDLALLEVEPATPFEMLPFRIGAASKVKQGVRAYALGYPLTDVLGRKLRVHEGIVSSVVGLEGRASQFQVEMALNPGNSGGPLVDCRGAVVGVVSSKLGLGYALQTESILEGVTFAVKSDLLWMLAASCDRAADLIPAAPTDIVMSLDEISESLAKAVVRIEVER